MLELLARLGFTRVEGIDVSPEQIELAARRGLAARVAGVFDHLAASEAAYAAILGFDFIEHFDREELLNLASAIHRALAPGGRLILRTPNGAGLLPHQVIYGDLTHLTVFTPGSLEQLLRWAGFTGFRFAETGPVPAGFRGRARVLGWYLVKLVANAVRMLEAGKRQALWTENMICCCRKPG
jgi:O-antigen chain-terminating methyltransferase